LTITQTCGCSLYLSLLTETGVRAQEESNNHEGTVALVPSSANLTDVVAALNALGASPRDLIAIFQALHAAGALRAEIEVQ
ncbi:MAG: flagellar basal body P-ring protein FlgI, partial [Myxococcota bacterium]